MAALGGRAAGLAIKYGARWLARTAVRRGVRSAAGTAARARIASAARQTAFDFSVQRALTRGFGVAASAIAGGGAYAAYASKKYAGKRPNPDPIFPPDKRQKMAVSTRSAIVRRKVSIGRKEPFARKALKLARTSQRGLTFNFRGIKTMSNTTGGNTGYFTLQQKNVDANWASMPVHVFNVTNYPQGRIVDGNGVVTVSTLYAPSVHWQLAIKRTGGDDNCSWLPGLNGQTNTVSTHPGWNLVKQDLGVVGASATPITRFGYLDYVNAKLMIYGKKKQDTKLRVQLVQFTRDYFCPEFDSMRGDNPINEGEKQEFCDVVKSYVKPLINNPIASRPRTTAIPFYRTIYSKYISIPPKDDSDSNDDPYIVQLNLFRRMNRLVDFNAPRDDPGETTTQLNDEAYVLPTEMQHVRGTPKNLRGSIYLMVSCWDPIELGDAAGSTDFQNTYDLNLQTKWTLEN